MKPLLVFPELHTERLHLRQLNIDDVDALVRHANNPRIAENILNIPYPYREHDAVFRISFVVQGFKERKRFVFAIIDKSTNALIGEISLHLNGNMAQMAYWLGETFWGQKLTTEAVAAVLQFGFERLELELIYAECHEDNIASHKVLLKNGFLKNRTMGKVIQFIKEANQSRKSPEEVS